MASLPWAIKKFSKDDSDAPFSKQVDEFLQGRLKHLDAVLTNREWLAGSFSIADILMADVLRLPDRFEGLADYPGYQKYLTRAIDRPAFKKAYADQMEYFAAADKQRA
jgi:glutathione S-transferase